MPDDLETRLTRNRDMSRKLAAPALGGTTDGGERMMSEYIEVDGLRVGPNMWRSLKEQLEQAEARVAELEDELEGYRALKRLHRLENYPNEITARAWLLRKQAEAVEAFLADLRSKQKKQESDFGVTVTRSLVGQGRLEDYAQRLRQLADEAEKVEREQSEGGGKV